MGGSVMASIINATTTGITVTGDNSGQLTLSANGSTALTANTTGYLNFAKQPTIGGSEWPAFSVFKSGSDQTLSDGTFTKVTFATETFDTNNNFASSTFTPTVAGYYQFTYAAQLFASAGTNMLITIYKNGSEYARGTQINLASGNLNLIQLNATNIIYCNGSTDYIEIYAYIVASASRLVAASSATYFAGCLLRGA